VIYAGVPQEACPLGLTPTASTTAMLALGDALAVALVGRRKFKPADFYRCHPGGELGERLRVPIQRIMRTEAAVPMVAPQTRLADALKEMSAKGLGATLVMADGGQPIGIITDGDLRRGLCKFADLPSMPVEAIMSRNPKTIGIHASVADALEVMEHHEITVLPVSGERGELVGIIHLHDLLGKGHIRFSL